MSDKDDWYQKTAEELYKKFFDSLETSNPSLKGIFVEALKLGEEHGSEQNNSYCQFHGKRCSGCSHAEDECICRALDIVYPRRK